MKLTRRLVLKGLGGVALGLPFLESFAPKKAHAQDAGESWALFFRQANGAAQAQRTGEIGDEPERFWPRQLGALTPESMSGRAVEELADFRSRLLLVSGVNMRDFNYGDGHARGALQCLTARGPTVEGQGGSSEANGESIDHRIGRELNAAGRDSLFLYAGQGGGWLGGPCISYRGPGQRRAAVQNPWTAYQTIVGGDSGVSNEVAQQIANRQKSVNDMVRGQMNRLLGRSRLSNADRQRLELHFDSIRELEVALTCRLAADQEATLEGQAPSHNSTDGDLVLQAARLHMNVAALAIACGYTRSVALQVGNGNDAATRYRHPMTGELMENFHYISHRRSSHDSNGAVIAGSDLLHHHVDRQFAATFRHLVSKLNEYEMPTGGTLLDKGVAVWFNDLSNGPAHGANNLPIVMAGSAGGALRQGEYIRVSVTGPNHNRFLNTIGSVVGVRNGSGGPLDDFGDPSLTRGILDEMLA